MCYICYRYVQNRGCLTSSDQISILNRKTLAQSDKWHHMELIFYLIRLDNHTRKKKSFRMAFRHGCTFDVNFSYIQLQISI